MNALLAFLFITFIQGHAFSTPTPAKSISVVTGASGFVGRHVVYSLLLRQKHANTPADSVDNECIVCLVRSNRVDREQRYWDAHLQNINGCSIKVMPYDMLDNGVSLSSALQYAQQSSPEKICLYHVASTFGPSTDPVQTAHDNVKSSVDAFRALASMQTDGTAAPTLRMVLTSSMAAVRATNQTPLNGKYYTQHDWNSLSTLDEKNWGSCYQWSKMKSEQKVLELVQNWNADNKNTGKICKNIQFVALCPSFVFGPPPPHPPSLSSSSDSGGSTSYSVQLVKQWLSGDSEVQSRLCADVRDVAMAHVKAGTIDLSTLVTKTPNCYRYILSTEERLSSQKVSDALKNAILKARGYSPLSFDLDRIKCDTKFDGGAIKIGEKEVEATERLMELGVVCRSVEETMEDMAAAIISDTAF